MNSDGGSKKPGATQIYGVDNFDVLAEDVPSPRVEAR